MCSLVLLYSVSSAWGASLVGNTKLTAPDGAAYDTFGAAISVTPDGKTALIGANDGGYAVSPGYDIPGAAYFFSTYATAAGKKVTPVNPPIDGKFGSPLALADNGTTAVIGAPSATVDGKYFHGLAYIFSNNNGGWTQQARLVDPDGAIETGFGCVADIADDGNTVLIGSCSNFYMNQTIGSVSIFVRKNGEWRLQKKFRGNDTEADDAFPSAVALSGDGNTALVGAFMDTVGRNNDQGSAYVFVRSGDQWVQQQQLTASDGAQWSMFGNAVALSNDGNTAMIGNSWKNTAYVFTRSGGVWSQQARLTPADLDPYSSNFAAALAMVNSGNIAVIGDNQCARLFVRNGSTWKEEAKLTTNDPEAYGFGQALALADDGKTVLVGAPSATVAGKNYQGAVYVFRPVIALPGANMLLLNSP
ncbi:MAG: FG-GAP repeat protein [Desulfobulbaceae bacterium]